MSVIWSNHATHLTKLIHNHNETEAHLYLEQLMLFPVDIQDKIIEDISQLQHCNNNAVSNIIKHYSIVELK